MATQRTRTASKALIPSLSDPVGKLNGLGGMTVKKLLDLGNQVAEARSAILADVPLAAASTGELPGRHRVSEIVRRLAPCCTHQQN